jgi:alkylhydroperoxidase/carboxymuconolactone decarboxylase family protein YurZ
MGIEPYPTPEDRLRALAAGQASVLESLAQMQSGALERSRLDRETYLLVRLAALVATDAAAVSDQAHLGGPGEPGLPVAKIIGVFGAIAPFVGSARVLSAASKLDLAGLLPAGRRRITPSG